MGMLCYPNTEPAWNKAVLVPLYPALQDKEIDIVIEAVKKNLSGWK